MRTAAAVRAVRDVDERARGVAVEQRVEEPQRPVPCVRARARVCACARACVRVCVHACVCARAPACVCVSARARVCVCVLWSVSEYVRVCARARVHHGPAALGEPRVVEQRDDPRERRACAMREPLKEYPVSTREHP